MKYNEILKLKKMLEEANIPFKFEELFDGYKITLHTGTVDAIQHRYSYGNEKDLLEIGGALTAEEYEHDGVKGFLSAEDVFNRFKYCYVNSTITYNNENMNNQQEIKQMAEVIEDARILARGYLGSLNEGLSMWLAKHLYEAGYRKLDIQSNSNDFNI